MTNDIFGVRIPDSKMARDLTQLIRNAEDDLLFYHSNRVYLWGALIGKRKGLTFDPELLYTAAMFHDIGLTESYRDSQLPFEVDGANAAREFLQNYSISERDIQKVWTAVALHTTPEIPEYMHPESALIQEGDEMDVVGRGSDDFPSEQREAVIAAYPRCKEFNREIVEAFCQGVRRRPDSTIDIVGLTKKHFQRASLCSIFLGYHWKH